MTSRAYLSPSPLPAADAGDDQVRLRAERSAREARALAEIVNHINQSLELDRVFALIARHAAELMQARGSQVWMLDEQQVVLVGGFAPGVDVGTAVPLEVSFVGECIRSRNPAYTRDMAAERLRWPWSAARASAEAPVAIAAPLLISNRVLGAIMVFADEERAFDEHDEELLLALANHASVAIENARLYRASVRMMRHANVLAASASRLAHNVTPDAMYADIDRVARTALGADGAGIYLADPTDGRVQLVFCNGAGCGANVDLALSSFWTTAAASVVRSGVPLFRRDLREFADEPVIAALLAQGLSSLAVLPLIVEGRPRGLLSLRFLTIQPFDDEQRQLVCDFSTHAAVAVRNALLFADLERRATRLAAVAQVQQAISATVAPDALYGEIYRAVAKVVDAPCFALLSFDEEEGVFVPEHVVNDGEAMDCSLLPHFPLGEGMTSQAFRSASPNVAARSGRGWTGLAHEAAGERQVAVILSAPVTHGEKVLGVLQAQSYRQDAYTWDDVDLIMFIARQAGTAIANARLFEAERREREQAEAVAAVARATLRAGTLDEAATAVLAILEQVIPSAGSALSVVTPGREGLRCIAARGTAAPLLGAVIPLPGRNEGDNGGITRVVREDGTSGPTSPLLFSHALLDEPLLMVQLSADSHPIGALLVTPATDPRDSRAASATLDRLAPPVALALDAMLLREEERREQRELRVLGAALDTMKQPVFVASPDAIIQYANTAALREYGYSSSEIIGLPVSVLTIPALTVADIDGVHRTIEEQGVWSGERLHRRADGSEFPVWVTVSAIRDGDGRRMGQVCSVRNLTEERRVAEQLRQSEKLAALGELVAGVAHEVNNPLTGISAFAQLLQEDTLSTDQLESVQLIKREADRAVAVIRDLLTFARKTGPRNVSVDINELIEQTLRLRAYGLRTAGITVKTTLDHDLRTVQGDDRQLQQVLLNLVVNAEHAMTGGSRRTLTIRTANEGARVVVEINDTGVGMSAEIQKRIFEPFFTTKPDGKGTGLGLSVSYGIVQTHEGTLTVQSREGAGSSFRISLPAAEPPVALTPRQGIA
ncbi:MAG TPA: GAF domain-containing protein [Gemmatimonadaceae bacterium]|nr:GAF domain-containing protein [Gemmatimonadaceae bacterium]